jgi:hypothetical protein
VHPFCPILADGRLFAAIPTSSPKGWDLRRDPRCAIHARPGPDDDELCIRAAAAEVSHDPSARGLVDVARWLDIGQPGTRAIRQRWRDV